MGTATFVKSTTPKSAVTGTSNIKLHVDVPLLLIVLALLAYGLVMLYSASWDFAVVHDMPATAIFIKQVRWVVLGLVLATIISMIDYHKYQKFIIVIMGGTIGMLLLVLVFGRGDAGPARGLLNGSIQPSELAKLIMVIYLSFWLYSKRSKIKTFGFGLFPVVAILGIVGGLILLQPDLSAAATVILIGGLLFFLAGAEWRQIILALAAVALIGWLGLKVYDTGASRLQDYLTGLQDMTKSSYHVMRAMEAVINGGWFGVGIGQSNVKFTGLPFPYTDSIFAVIVEEMGLLGAAGVVLLFGLLLWRGLSIARNAPDQLGSLLASGITFWIVLEAMLNMAVIIGLFPFAGNALPFFSAGGSNLVTTLMAVGILMNISRTNLANEAKDGSAFSAVVDLRRWNGRRRVSRTSRSSSSENQG